jgi:nicotinate-nucleotide pyrophosphorylase (carboxylating)
MKLLVLGAGAWGTALAANAAARHEVTLWARDPAQAAVLRQRRENPATCPASRCRASLRVADGDPVGAGRRRDLVIVATPMAGLREQLQSLRGCPAPVAWLCKGFEAGAEGGLLGHEVQAEVAPDLLAGVLTGPSFAQEVARGQPTALVAASPHAAVRDALVAAFHGPAVRVYANDDLVGAEVGGAVKNVLAIATGLCDGSRWAERARGAGHARAGGDDAAGPRAGRPRRHLHGPVGPGRPGAHGHRRPEPQPAGGPAAGPGPHPAAGGGLARATWPKACCARARWSSAPPAGRRDADRRAAVVALLDGRGGFPSSIFLKTQRQSAMSLRFDFSASAVAALALADATRALQEDVADGDLTASLVDPARKARARVLAREAAVVCGAPWVEATLRQLDPQVRITWLCAEGERCAADQTVLEIEGTARALLTAERTSLNFLQLLSAVATKTALYADAVEGTRARIVDTRKTLPGLRLAQKYAVRTGGGLNHRIGLYDAVLIKENHIAAAGGVAAALRAVAPVADRAAFVEVEVETLAQLREALGAGARMVLLDNMDLPTLREAVRINDEAGDDRKAVLEISGGVTLEGLRALAETGVDRISVGALTKDVKAIDFSMRFQES